MTTPDISIAPASKSTDSTQGCTNTCDLPMAEDEPSCTLSANQQKERLAMIHSDIQPYMLHENILADGRCWEFKYSESMQTKLEQLILLERQCCNSLQWNLERSAKKLQLTVQGIDPHSPLFSYMANSGGSRSSHSVIGRLIQLIKACVAGVVGAITLCCVLPIGIALVAGASVAAPLYKLENPLVMSIVALLIAITTWLFLTRKKRKIGKGFCGTDC